MPSAADRVPGARRGPSVAVLSALGVLAALCACAGVLKATGAASVPTLPGLPTPARSTPWLLPIARLIARLAQVALVGFALAAAVLLPADRGQLGAQGWQALRRAGAAAVVWAIAQLAMIPLTAADLLGEPAWTLSINRVLSTVREVDTGKALMLGAGFAAACAAVALVAMRRSGALVVLALSLVALVPQAASGHASASGNHQLAVSGLYLHLLGAVIWGGGLIALVLGARSTPTPMLSAAARRYSCFALPAAGLVVLSGLLAAQLRLGFLPSRWLTTNYGVVVLLKAAATIALLVIGLRHRRATLRRLGDGDRSAFVNLAVAEALLFAGTLGLATALTRVAPPQLGGPETNAQTLLGFAMPAPLTASRLLFDWYPEPLFLTGGLVAIGLYLGAVARLRGNGVPWPRSRTVAWVGGWLLVIFAMCSGMARYAPVLATVHMSQHLLLAMYAAPLLALAAPVTLALRALRPAADPDLPGPREALLAAINSRYSRVVTQPVVALAFLSGGMFVVFFSGLYEMSLRSHVLHVLISAEFLISGYLFYYAIIGVDPGPVRAPAPMRLIVLLIATIAHTVFGIALMSSSAPLAPTWFEQIARPWGTSALEDTQNAGGLAWAFGELPAVLILLVLVLGWAKSDEREQRRRDRAADIKGSAEADAIDAYNDMLAKLADRDRRSNV